MFNNCLISVSDKSGLEQLLPALKELAPQARILSTGGTARRLRELEAKVTDVSDFTGFPEAFEGRIKTLHPKIHGGLLFRRGLDDERAAELGIEAIDLVVVNLYPFAATYAAGGRDLVEQIDIGGPTMLRSAAKNSDHVITLCDPADYAEFIERARAGQLDADYRRRLQARVFAHTAAYDAQIAAVLCDQEFPERLSLSLTRTASLRYGENPHQPAALYRVDLHPPDFVQHQGKELSYNNLLDLEAARLPLPGAAAGQVRCCVVKHAAPCGLGEAASAAAAFELAWKGDPMSAFGSVIGFSGPVDQATAELLAGRFIEVVVAPAFSAEALEILSAKTALRVLTTPARSARLPDCYRHQIKISSGVALLQQGDDDQGTELNPVSATAFPADLESLARFGLTAVRCLKSNAIALVARTDEGCLTIGLGGGQPNRVEAVQHALQRAQRNFPELLPQALLASDAFFPFPDSIEAAAQAGVRRVVAPGGSKKDQDVIAACDRLGVALAFTGRRYFRH